jgi:hypothetical protein
MNTNVRNISEIVDDIKEKLTDYQYKTIMDNLMALNNKKEEVEAEVEREETDKELEEPSSQISLLDRYVSDDDELKNILKRFLRLNIIQFI